MSVKRRTRKTNTIISGQWLGALLLAGLALTVHTGCIAKDCTDLILSVGALAVLLIIMRPIADRIRRNNLCRADFDTICEMQGITFEQFCKEKFEQLGYRASDTPTTGDFGADLILKKYGVTTAVQCKRYSGCVGIAAVQEVIGARGYYKTDKALVITNSTFTKAAKELASANDVELWDKTALIARFKVKA